MRTDALPTPLAVMAGLAVDPQRDDLTRLKSYCDLAEHATRLLAAIGLAECRRLDVTNARIAEALGRLSTTGLQLGHWVGLLEATRAALKGQRGCAVPEIITRARAWGGSHYGYLDWLKKILRLRNELHHSSLQLDPGALRARLAECERYASDLLESVEFLAELPLLATGAAGTPSGHLWWIGPDPRRELPGLAGQVPAQPDAAGTYAIRLRAGPASRPAPALRLDPLLVSATCPECGTLTPLSLDRLGGLQAITYISHRCAHRPSLPALEAAARELLAWSTRSAAATDRPPAGPVTTPAKRTRLTASQDRAACESIVATALGEHATREFRVLTAEQLEAVLYDGGPAVVLAGAGTGKTRILASKAAWLYCSGVSADRILAVTFTNRAAREMRERLDHIWGAAAPVAVSTIHAACCRLLREADDPGPHVPANFAIADRVESEELALAACAAACAAGGLALKEYEIRNYIRMISHAKEAMLTPQMVQRRATPLAAEIYERYERMLRERGQLDFADLIWRACQLLERSEPVLAATRDTWQWVLVDEYQDLNDAQVKWLSLVLGHSPRYFLAGDDDQMIYGWRGARAARIVEAAGREGVRRFVLSTNFRSTRMILEAAGGLIARNGSRIQKQMSFGFAAAGEPVVVHELGNPQAEAEWVAERIRDRAEQLVLDEEREPDAPLYAGQAVLARTHRLLEPIAEALESLDVPFRVISDPTFLEAAAVRGCLAAMRYAVNPTDRFALIAALSALIPGLPLDTVHALAETAAGRAGSNAPAAAKSDLGCVDLGRGSPAADWSALLPEGIEGGEHVAALLESVSVLRTCLTGNDAACRAVTQLTALVEVPETSEGQATATALEELYMLALEHDQEHGNESSLQGFVTALSLQASDYSMHPDGDEVRLMTMHAAKGLEFASVHLIGTCRIYMPMTLPGVALDERSGQERIEEERRLLYVAMTRAREHLVITYPGSRARQADGRPYGTEPSPFLGELGRGVRWM